MTKRKADWFFDVISPFAYLQWREMARFQSHMDIAPRPVLFAGLLKAWGQLGPAEIPEKRLATYRFCVWKAKKLGVPFCMPPRHPFNPLPLLRLILSRGSSTDDITAVFNAVWADGRDVTDPQIIDDIAAGLGPASASQLNAEATKAALRANTDAAVALGVYGVPTFAVEDASSDRPRLFWGHDAGDWLLDWLDDGTMFDRPDMQRAENCAIGVERPR